VSSGRIHGNPDAKLTVSRRSVLVAAKLADFFKTMGWAFPVKLMLPASKVG